MSSSIRSRGVGWGVAFAALVSVANASAQSLERVDRKSVLQEALRVHPGLRAAEQQSRATELGAGAKGSLPPPEIMAQIWQIPISRPYAVNDASMLMVGVSQAVPAPGSRAARERAGMQTAAAERAMIEDRARRIRRDAEHAFIDFVEASERHSIHVEHRELAQRALALARARHASGAPLTDVTQADAELARMEADVIGDRTREEGARSRLNALLGRDPTSPLGRPIADDASISAWDLSTELLKAEDTRAELRAAVAETHARAEEAQAASQEAKLPSFSVAALYFAPVGPMPTHGYGANASMSLPWIWGEKRAQRDSARKQLDAARSEWHAATFPVHAEVAMADATMRSAALRFQSLTDRALPATRRSLDVAWAGYESGRADVLTLLSARRAVVDIASEIVVARANLDHALAELDAAVGASVPRRPLRPADVLELEKGANRAP